MSGVGPRLSLAELRRQRGLRQRDLAVLLATRQPNVSKIEAGSDHQLSTLAKFVTGLGGDLRLMAEFDGDRFEIAHPVTAPRSSETYRVVWQNPDTRKFIAVGRLDYDGRIYRFRYDSNLDPTVVPFPAFPDVTTDYRAAGLWPFFEARSGATAGPSPVSALLGGSSPEQVPVELVADEGTHGGVIQLVPTLGGQPDGSAQLEFLVSGVRHAIENEPRAASAISNLTAGDHLELRRDFTYKRSESHARRLLSDGVAVGWFPDYAVSDADELEFAGFQLTVDVVWVGSKDMNPHLRLLCRLRGVPSRPSRTK